VPKEQGRAPGRRPKLTPELEKEICKYLELSVPAKYAAKSCGISESTFHDWMSKGAAGIEPYAGFRDAVERSSARAVPNLTARALSGAKGSSQATWLLERLFRNEYGPQLQIGGIAGGEPIRIDAERQAADATRADPVATAKLHEIIGQLSNTRPASDVDADKSAP
jgi:hypothetical protein